MGCVEGIVSIWEFNFLAKKSFLGAVNCFTDFMVIVVKLVVARSKGEADYLVNEGVRNGRNIIFLAKQRSVDCQLRAYSG